MTNNNLIINELGYATIGSQIVVGRDFAYVLNKQQETNIRKLLSTQAIVATTGQHMTVTYSLKKSDQLIPFDGSSARLIYIIAMDMKLIDEGFLPTIPHEK